MSPLPQQKSELGCGEQDQKSPCEAVRGCYWGTEKAAGATGKALLCFNKGVYAKITGNYFPDIDYQTYWVRGNDLSYKGAAIFGLKDGTVDNGEGTSQVSCTKYSLAH